MAKWKRISLPPITHSHKPKSTDMPASCNRLSWFWRVVFWFQRQKTLFGLRRRKKRVLQQ
ncbi:MAG: hypothetical protein AB9866_23215 [Syntrophobacteraceae bacterium]